MKKRNYFFQVTRAALLVVIISSIILIPKTDSLTEVPLLTEPPFQVEDEYYDRIKNMDTLKSLRRPGCPIIDFAMTGKYVPDDRYMWLEFGVWTGGTLNQISTHTNKTVFGFDSFEGLPEVWDRENKGWWSDKGSFSLQGKLPKVNQNVKLIKGWYFFHNHFKALVCFFCFLLSATQVAMRVRNMN